MADVAGAVIGVVLGISFGIFVLLSIYYSFIIVRSVCGSEGKEQCLSHHFYSTSEKQQIVLERLGRYHATLTPGLHFITPWIDWPKSYSVRYYQDNTSHGQAVLVSRQNITRVPTQDEIMDLPRQACITRDNASVFLDVLLSWRCVNPKAMLYSSLNTPLMIGKMLQAQIRAVAGALDVDALIEETASMDRVAGELSAVTQRWGVAISFVKFQRVDAGQLTEVLAKRKNADLENQSIIIRAKATKQKTVIESEGIRDRTIREAEGEAQQLRSRARGEAKAITNTATAQAEEVREVALAISRAGENPTRYLLAMKYLDALRDILSARGTRVSFLPVETTSLQSMQSLGVSPNISVSNTGPR